MKQIFTIAYYESLQMLRQRTVWVMLFLMPLLIIFILGSALSAFFYTKPVTPEDIRMGVYMEDTGFIRTVLMNRVTGSGPAGMRIVYGDSKLDLHSMVKGGQADFGIVIREGFSQGLQQGLAPRWEFISGANIRKSMTGLQAAYAFFDQWNHRFAERGGWEDGVPPTAEQDLLMPGDGLDVSYVDIPEWNAKNDNHSAVQYYSVHMLIMFMLYSGLSSGVSMILAKEDHTLMRMRSLPVPGWCLLLGKVIGQGGIMLLQALLLIAGTAILYGVSWGSNLGVLAAICLLVMVFTLGTAVTLGIMCKTKPMVILLFQVLITGMTFLAGGFSPAIGDMLSQYSGYTMSYWASQSLLQLSAGADPSLIHHHLAILALFAAGAALSAAAVFGKAGYHE